MSSIMKTEIELIPHTPNPSPDYYCTWQTQLYATSDGKPAGQRRAINERSLFSAEYPYSWASFYPEARQDLFIVLDDSWDVPENGDGRYFGSLLLDRGKFASFYEGGRSPKEAMRLLSDKIKAIGWKGLGLWVCCQKPKPSEEKPDGEYWEERLSEAASAGVRYWKVDWGERCRDSGMRRLLASLSHSAARGLTVENAMCPELVPYSDTYRTYDVPALMSIPMTVAKLAAFLDTDAPREGFAGILNCEDEAYIAAAGGFSMGIMRHPYAGALPDGRPDMSFPALHRNIKTKQCEVTRAVRFHRLAPAFGSGREETEISEKLLTDTWRFEKPEEEIEAWWLKNPLLTPCLKDGVLEVSGVAAICRRMPLPKVEPDENGDVPFIAAAKNPNGVVSLVTAGRTRERSYFIPRCRVAVEGGCADTFGIFGEYRELVLHTSTAKEDTRVLLQDAASPSAYDVTEEVRRENGRVVLPGELLHRIGTEAQALQDTSEPGAVLKLLNE